MANIATNLTNIQITRNDDGIWLHFESKKPSRHGSIPLKSLLAHGYIVNSAIENWAEEQLEKGIIMPTKRELEAQIHHHRFQISTLETMMKDVPKQIEQLKATIELKQKALAEIEEKEKE
jgi:predicted RNase H-like nuclease (RuvC/YqgF family)